MVLKRRDTINTCSQLIYPVFAKLVHMRIIVSDNGLKSSGLCSYKNSMLLSPALTSTSPYAEKKYNIPIILVTNHIILEREVLYLFHGLPSGIYLRSHNDK